MIRHLLIGLAIVAGATFGATQTALAQWKLGHVTSPTSDYQEFSNKFKELLETRSAGRIKLSVFPAGQLGNEADLFKQVKGGAVEFAIHGVPGLASYGVKEAVVFDFPYLVRTQDQGVKLLSGPFGDWFRETVHKQTQVRVLGFLDLGFRNVYNRVRDVKTPEDLKGLKIRVVPAPSYIATYQALGVNTTPMAYTEVYQALQQGAIDGGEATAKQMVADRLMEVSKYYSFTKVTYNPIALLVSPKLFDGLSAADKQLVEQAAREALAYHSVVSRRMDQEAVVAMRQKGLVVSEPDTAPFERLLKPALWEKLKADIPNGTEVLARLSAAVDAAAK